MLSLKVTFNCDVCIQGVFNYVLAKLLRNLTLKILEEHHLSANLSIGTFLEKSS